jgi:hypothetical protein
MAQGRSGSTGDVEGTPHVAAAPRPAGTLRSRVEGISDLLSDLKGSEMRISSMLLDFGLCEAQIEHVRRNHMEEVAELLLSALREHLSVTPRGKQMFAIIERRYGLSGHARETLGSVGSALGIGRERVRQLQDRTLMRWRERQHAWEDAFHDAVRDLLWEKSTVDDARDGDAVDRDRAT